MPRKNSNFSKLYDYITNKQDINESSFNFTRNTFGVDKNDLINEFIENSELLRKRDDWNIMYHEIIALSETSNLSREAQKEKLRDLAEIYLSERAPDCLAFGGLHDEQDKPLHYHIMLSANAVGQENRHYLAPHEFQLVKDRVEEYTLERYPELEQKKVMALDRYNQAKGKTKEKWQEASMKIRTGKMSKKDLFRERVLEGLSSVSSWQNYDQELEKMGVLQTSRKRASFLDLSSGKKYRITTLGLEKEYSEMTKRLNEKGQNMNQEEQKKQNKKTAGSESEFDKYKARAEKENSYRYRSEMEKDAFNNESEKAQNDIYKQRAEALHKEKLKEQERANKGGYTQEDLKRKAEAQQRFKYEDRKNEEEHKITEKMYKAMTKSKLIECVLAAEQHQDFMKELNSNFLGLHRIKDEFYITDFETMKSYPVRSLKLDRDIKKLLNYSDRSTVKGQFKEEPTTEYVKGIRDLELKDHLKETAKEFIFGDFSHHAKRESLMQSQKRMKDWQSKATEQKTAEYEAYNLGSKYRQEQTREKAKTHYEDKQKQTWEKEADRVNESIRRQSDKSQDYGQEM